MTRAVVCADGVDTHYVRAGRGKPIVMVSDDVESAEVQEMIMTLSHDHLVFAAAPRLEDAAGLAAWLRGFVEGLGIGEAHVILHGSRAGLVLHGPA